MQGTQLSSEKLSRYFLGLSYFSRFPCPSLPSPPFPSPHPLLSLSLFFAFVCTFSLLPLLSFPFSSLVLSSQSFPPCPFHLPSIHLLSHSLLLLSYLSLTPPPQATCDNMLQDTGICGLNLIGRCVLLASKYLKKKWSHYSKKFNAWANSGKYWRTGKPGMLQTVG